MDARTEAVEQTLERAAASELGLETDFFVRTGKEWQGKLGTRGTARNWNTVLRLAALTG